MEAFLSDLARHSFLQYALVGGVLASVACGIVGTYVVVRRSTYVAGAIAHTVLGGMGAARYLERQHGLSWATPMVGATVAALLAAAVIGLVTLYARERQDTVLSAVWAVGMAVGISFITATPGYYEDLMSYLFGNILMIGRATPPYTWQNLLQDDLWLMGFLDIVIVVAVLLLYNKLLAVSFHEELARLRGLRAGVYHMLLLVLTALTVVLLTQVVGLVLVIALLTLPAATAGQLVRRLWQMMVLAVVLSCAFTVGGLALSYGPELPAGATIVELAAGTYLAVLIVRRLARAVRGWLSTERNST